MAGFVRNWRGEEFVREVAEALEGNMAIAAKLAEDDARRRLSAIDDPRWGAGYRQRILAPRVTSFVERDGSNVVGWVGIGAGSAAGEAASHGGFYIETGSRTAPAHPWLRPAVFENLADIKRVLVGL